MSQDWNAYNSSSASFGNSVPVWVKTPKRLESGGLIDKTNLVAGEIISAASPFAFNTTTKAAKLLKIFKVKAVEVISTDTKITVYAIGNLPKLHNGDFVMVLPSTLAGTGKAVAVASLDLTVEGEASFTVATANIDSVAAGTYLVQSSATAAGSSKSIYCIPNTLSIDDTIVGNQNSIGLARGEKYLYENTAPWLPAIVAAAIPMLELHHFNEVQNSGYVAD
jgi:uncharacterized protein with beta-barrel porin domain